MDVGRREQINIINWIGTAEDPEFQTSQAAWGNTAKAHPSLEWPDASPRSEHKGLNKISEAKGPAGAGVKAQAVRGGRRSGDCGKGEGGLGQIRSLVGERSRCEPALLLKALVHTWD